MQCVVANILPAQQQGLKENQTLKFSDLGFGDDLLQSLDLMGFETPTPIQEEAIPYILEGRDIIACAQTGTGKTAAYLLPVLERINREGTKHTSALIIAPTRELAQQIDQQVEGFAYFTGATSCPVYGGEKSSWDQQKNALTQGADIIIATPGRLMAHLKFEYVKLDKLDYLILDEADRMLDMGFFDDIMSIVSYLPEKRQNLLFSATMPPKIRTLSKKMLHNPAQVSIAISKPAAGILQAAYEVRDELKVPLLCDLMKNHEKLESILIFSSTKKNVKNIVNGLKAGGYPARAISSDLNQEEREEVIRGFKSKRIQILVATDILSRGIDIESISLVINYDVPHDAEDYVHRIGRTARAASTGVALTFVNGVDSRKFKSIESLIEMKVNRVPVPSHLKPDQRFVSSSGRSRGSSSRGGGSRGGSGGGRSRSNSNRSRDGRSGGSSRNKNRTYKKRKSGSGSNKSGSGSKNSGPKS